jgi:iron complex transport system substrate-binding protein
LCLVLIVAAWPDGQAGASVVVQDDRGRIIELEAPAQRIIALYGAFNEVLGAMGLEERLVARTNTDRLPPCILDKPTIGTHMRPNVEMVVGLKPDLVLQMSGRSEAGEAVAALERFNIPVAWFEVADFNGLYSMISRLGVLTGAQERAAGLIEAMEARLQRVTTVLESSSRRPLVFFEVRYPNLLGAGSGSIVNEIIERAGGINCIKNQKKLVRLSEETLLQLAPEVYLIQEGAMNPSPAPLADRPHYRTLPAVTTGRIYPVDEQVFSRPGPRNIEAVEHLARVLHPNLAGILEIGRKEVR